MLFRLKETIRNGIIRFFMASKNDLTQMAEDSFSPEGYTRKHIANTTIITMFEKDGDVRFFRECRRHNGLKQYVFDAIEDYFEKISAFSEAAQLKQSVLTDLKQNANYRRLIQLGEVFNRHLTEILCGIYDDYRAVGVPCFARFDAQEEFIAFIKYISGIVISQKTNTYLSSGSYENYSANKQLATYRLACLLGVESLITPVQVCAFFDGDAYKLGTLMEKAPGYPPSDTVPEKRTNLAHETFLKDITNLEYLDALCYQLDHRLDNYYVVENAEGKIAHVVTFDNDAARTFFVSSKLPGATYAGCCGVLAKDGTVARPYMDKAFADALLACTKAKVKECVGSLMSGTQLRCLWKRIRSLQQAVTITAAGDREFLVEDWNTVSLQKAGDSRYGRTYYTLYLTDTLMLDRQALFAKMKQQK